MRTSTAAASVILRRNLLIYGLGGLVVPFAGIKLVDLALERGREVAMFLTKDLHLDWRAGEAWFERGPDPVLATIGLMVFPLVILSNLVFQHYSSPLMTRAQALRAELAAAVDDATAWCLLAFVVGRWMLFAKSGYENMPQRSCGPPSTQQSSPSPIRSARPRPNGWGSISPRAASPTRSITRRRRPHAFSAPTTSTTRRGCATPLRRSR